MDRQYPIDNVRGWIVKRPILSLSLAALVALLAGVGIGIAGAGDSEAEDLRGELAELEAERDQLAEDLKTAEEEAWENRQEVLDLRAELRGDDEPEPAEEEAPEPDHDRAEDQDKDGTGRFRGVHAHNYRTARTVCGAFPQRKVAQDLGLSPNADAVTIAEAYAEGKQPAYRQAAFEGCLEGLP